jgi:lactoylglutathione lyase
MTGAVDRLAYVILYVRDLTASIAFYRDLLGVPFRFEDDGYAEFATQGARFALMENARLPEILGRNASPEGRGKENRPRQSEAAPDQELAGVPGAGATAPHGVPAGEILFLVDNVDRQAARLESTGANIVSGPVDRPWGHRTLHLFDPDGHVVELAQEIPRLSPRH